jgi:hypothetical protein
VGTYRDYVKLGISEKCRLLFRDSRTGVMTLDMKLGKYLFKKTEGKVGLTVQIIKKVLGQALTDNRKYPVFDDFRKVLQMDKDVNIDPISSIAKKMKRKKVVIQYQDNKCKIKGCPNYNEEVSHHSELLDHYRTVHPEYKIMNKDGHEIR